MIITSCYKNWQSDKYSTCSISRDRGKDANYKGKCYPKLAPKLNFWNVWHNNIGVISEEENNRYYIEQYYEQVLSKLNPEKLVSELNYEVLLCYEDNTEFCHRHIVAAWLELLLGIEVKEAKANDYDVQIVSKPEYIKDYLEKIMKMNRNMRRFNSLRALYLFEKGEELERKADELEEKTGKCYDHYRQEACFLRCDADEAEEKYNQEKRAKVKKLTN